MVAMLVSIPNKRTFLSRQAVVGTKKVKAEGGSRAKVAATKVKGDEAEEAEEAEGTGGKAEEGAAPAPAKRARRT